MEYQRYSGTYGYEDVSVATPPPLSANIKQPVFVTHGESTFYANDYQQCAWLESIESFIMPKPQGRSIMISEFQCPRHGTMRAVIDGKEMISRVVFYAGAAYQSYWTSENMIAQLRDVLALFNFLHEDMVTVFLFDQSSNHKAFAKDALVANIIYINACEIFDNDVKVRNGFYIDEESGIKERNFYVEQEYDYPALVKVQFSKIDRSTKSAKIYEIVNKILPVSFIFKKITTWILHMKEKPI